MKAAIATLARSPAASYQTHGFFLSAAPIITQQTATVLQAVDAKAWGVWLEQSAEPRSEMRLDDGHCIKSDYGYIFNMAPGGQTNSGDEVRVQRFRVTAPRNHANCCLPLPPHHCNHHHHHHHHCHQHLLTTPPHPPPTPPALFCRRGS